MKNWIIKQVIGSQAPKYIRHLLAMLGAWMTAKGFDGNADHLVELLTGVATILLSTLWSVIAKAPPNANLATVISTIAGAAARQAQTALGTLLAIRPDDLATVSTSGLIMIGLNILISRLDASDHPGPTRPR